MPQNMEAKRKLPYDPGSHTPVLKKECHHEPEDFNFEVVEMENFKSKTEFSPQVEMEADPLAVKNEATEEDHKFDHNILFAPKQEPQAPKNHTSPENYIECKVKVEGNESLRIKTEELHVADSNSQDDSGQLKNEGDICTRIMDGSNSVMEQLISAESTEEAPETSYGFHPSSTKRWFEFAQPLDQEPSIQLFPNPETSFSISCDHSLVLAESDNTSSSSSSSVSVSMLLKHPFNSGFWTVDQQNQILIEPIPFSGSDCNRKTWMDKFSIYPWLCKTNELGRFFCWPCLLFGKPRFVFLQTNPNLERFEETLIDHQTKLQHQEAQELYITTKNIIYSLNGESHLNQEMWRYLVQAICSERRKMLAFTNTPAFEFKITPMMQFTFHRTITQTSVFKLSKAILAAATTNMKMRIIEDVQKAQYVTLHIEDLSPTMRDGSWHAVIARYADQDGHIHEKVLDFFKIYTKLARSDHTMAEQVKFLFEDYKLLKNVIGISYSATVVRPRDILLFNNILLKWCPQAIFFHPPVHSLYKSLFQAISHTGLYYKYLQELYSICKFLNKYAATIESEDFSISNLPKMFDEHFIANFKSFFPAVTHILSIVKSSKRYRGDVKREAMKYFNFLKTVDNRILMILFDAICCSVADLAEAVDGPLSPLTGTFYDFKYLANLREQCLWNLHCIVTRSIEDIVGDEILVDATTPLHKKYQHHLQFIVGHTRDFLMQRFENWEQFRYTHSELLESSFENSKHQLDFFKNRMSLDETELAQLELGGTALIVNKSYRELLNWLLKNERQHTFPGLFKYLLYAHTLAINKLTFQDILDSVYSFIEDKSPDDLTTAYFNEFFCQAEDNAELLENPELQQKVLEACHSELDLI